MEEKQSNDPHAAGPDGAQQHEGTASSAPPLPDTSFAAFIISLSSSALLHLGEIADPATNQKQRNLPLAKQTIDILGILKEKTAGNLERDENQLLESLLYDLRIRYIEYLNKDAG